MRYSANLNIIIKAIEKASIHLPRDFMELENLQSNPNSADNFARHCHAKVKKIITEDIMKFRPDFNITFDDGSKIINNNKAEYNLLIYAIDGFDNLARSNPNFSIAVALQHIDENGEKNSIAVAINNSFSKELYYAEKGFGAFLNSRRIRVSKRTGSNLNVFCQDRSFLEKDSKFQILSLGAKTLEISYLASARAEKLFISNEQFKIVEPFALLVKEAGGKIEQKDNFFIIGN